jgi:hypothetical protein
LVALRKAHGQREAQWQRGSGAFMDCPLSETVIAAIRITFRAAKDFRRGRPSMLSLALAREEC